MKKQSIALVLVPIFALSACNDTQEYSSQVTASQDESVTRNDEGFYTTEDLANLNKSFEEAKANGYTGSLDDWIGLVQLSQTNPQQAQQVAQDSGFNGSEMLLGALAGAAVGAIAGNALSSRSNMATDTYSAQRTNNTTNYAYSQPYKKDDCKNNTNCRTTSGGGYVNTTNNSAAVFAANRNNSTSNLNSTRNVTTAPRTSVSTPTTVRSTSISRGGFGGSFSGGGG